jgi:vitamin B12 transporter
MSLNSVPLVFFLLFSLRLAAQQTPVTLPEATVTANRTEQKQAQTGKVVTVLTDSLLQRYAGQSVAELLSRQAGLFIAGAQGPLGTNQDVYLRGAGTGNTLVLLDGLPVYDPSFIAPTFDLNLLTVGECERIEILKGAQSTLYGSDAVAGVINIFTRKGATSGKPFGGTATLQGGSFGTFRGTLGLNGSTEKAYYNVQFTRETSRGFSAATDRTGTGTFDDDGFRLNALLANLGLYLRPNLLWKFRVVANRYRADLDNGAFQDEKDFRADSRYLLLATGFEFTHRKGRLTVNYGFGDSQRDYLDDSTSVEAGAFSKFVDSRYGTRTQFAEAVHVWNLSPALSLVTGAEYRGSNTDQTYLSVSSFGADEAPPIGADTARMHQFSAYASGLLKTKRGFFLEAGGRLNRHSLYGGNATYSLNPSYVFRERLKAFVNLSLGFRVPSLYQLFSPYGNRALRPETSRSLEFGVQVFTKKPGTNLRVLYFDRRIRDVFFFQSLPVDPFGRYVNFDRQHDHGWEVEGQAVWGKVSFRGNGTLLDGAVTTQVGGRDTTYNNLFRRPKLLWNATLSYAATPKLLLSTSLRRVGERFDRFFNNETFATETVRLAPYATLDLYAEYQFSKQFRLYADLRNLSDAVYADVYGFNTRRRNGTVGVRVEL